MSFFLGNGPTQTELISAQLAEHSTIKKEQREFLQAVINEFNNSKKRRFMDVAQRYYDNENDILQSKRKVIGKDAEGNATLFESKVLSNNTLCHAFMSKLTDQKVGYMLGKPFDIVSQKADDKKAEEFFAILKEQYFTKKFYRTLKEVGRDSIIKGIGWLMIYYDENGEFKTLRCNAEDIIPFWSDSEHTELDAVVRKYTVEKYKGGEKKEIRYVEYYTQEGVYYYYYGEDGKLLEDPDHPDQPSPHFYLRNVEDNNLVGTNWSKIPFVPFKYDPREKSLLQRIKTLIDDYDKKTSGIANNIDDFPNAVTVIKNYDGESREDFVHKKNEYRTIFVQGDGDAKALETPLNISEVEKHLERLRQDIYEFGQGVNTANKDIRDTSGVALRFMYADLDMDCSNWSGEVESGLTTLIWFIQQDIKAKMNKDFTDVRYDIIFNTDVIVNETETINNCSISVGTISGDTIAANHPWTKDSKRELELMRKEQGETLDLEAEYGQDINTALNGQRVSVQ